MSKPRYEIWETSFMRRFLAQNITKPFAILGRLTAKLFYIWAYLDHGSCGVVGSTLLLLRRIFWFALYSMLEYLKSPASFHCGVCFSDVDRLNSSCSPTFANKTDRLWCVIPIPPGRGCHCCSLAWWQDPAHPGVSWCLMVSHGVSWCLMVSHVSASGDELHIPRPIAIYLP